ncbi:MAG: tetratricopeptide repeat protein [Rhodobacteraceae bacterium]|nr:tetratricopeptide repeat protein [Paracoccaceae bacterium]
MPLAACVTPGGQGLSGNGPYAPAARAGAPDIVDPLTVGHRLMAAGEYELALDSYYRAAAEQGATAEILSAIGSANLQLGRLGQAERILRRALEIDNRSVPAWNNLGVVLMEKGEVAEASLVFKTAFALDSGQTDSIRENLRLALAKLDNPAYDPGIEAEFTLVRQDNGVYLLLSRK